MKTIKNLILLLLLVNFFSCKKVSSPEKCNCGEIIELYSRSLNPSSENSLLSINISLGYKVKVKNNCTGKINTFKTDKTSYYEGEEFCESK